MEVLKYCVGEQARVASRVVSSGFAIKKAFKDYLEWSNLGSGQGLAAGGIHQGLTNC